MKFYPLLNLKKILLFIFMVLFSVPGLKAQLSGNYKTYKEGNHLGMRYGLFSPENYDSGKAYPLIVYLHGSGDTVSHDLGWYQPMTQKENPCFVLSPKCLERNLGWGDTWHEEHPDAASKTLSLVADLMKKYNIDTNRLYIYGISMGGFGVFSMLSKEQGKFAAAYAVCGGSDVKVADQFLNTPLWIFHGDQDDVVPVKLSRNVYHEMVRLGGGLVRYTEYPGVKHNSWENVLREKSLGRWLLLQEKGRTTQSPNQITKLFVEAQPTGAKLTWIIPPGKSDDKIIWYFKLFRDNNLLTELEGDQQSYIDLDYKEGSTYYLVGVNYFFQESKPSISVKIK